MKEKLQKKKRAKIEKKMYCNKAVYYLPGKMLISLSNGVRGRDHFVLFLLQILSGWNDRSDWRSNRLTAIADHAHHPQNKVNFWSNLVELHVKCCLLRITDPFLLEVNNAFFIGKVQNPNLVPNTYASAGAHLCSFFKKSTSL